MAAFMRQQSISTTNHTARVVLIDKGNVHAIHEVPPLQVAPQASISYSVYSLPGSAAKGCSDQDAPGAFFFISATVPWPVKPKAIAALCALHAEQQCSLLAYYQMHTRAGWRCQRQFRSRRCMFRQCPRRTHAASSAKYSRAVQRVNWLTCVRPVRQRSVTCCRHMMIRVSGVPEKIRSSTYNVTSQLERRSDELHAHLTDDIFPKAAIATSKSAMCRG